MTRNASVTFRRYAEARSRDYHHEKPSTGYLWEVGFYNQSVLKPEGEPEFFSTNTNLGAEESQKLHFEAIGEGETELILVYRRSFEEEDVNQQTFQIDVTVK